MRQPGITILQTTMFPSKTSSYYFLLSVTFVAVACCRCCVEHSMMGSELFSHESKELVTDGSSSRLNPNLHLATSSDQQQQTKGNNKRLDHCDSIVVTIIVVSFIDKTNNCCSVVERAHLLKKREKRFYCEETSKVPAV